MRKHIVTCVDCKEKHVTEFAALQGVDYYCIEDYEKHLDAGDVGFTPEVLITAKDYLRKATFQYNEDMLFPKEPPEIHAEALPGGKQGQPYFTLFIKGSTGWEPDFGDYARAVVREEADLRGLGKRDFVILKHGDTKEAQEAATKDLNKVFLAQQPAGGEHANA